MRLIDADALDMAFTNLRFNKDMSLAHWGDRKDWCLHGHEVEKLIYDAPTIGGWISVKDRLPEKKRDYLIYNSDGIVWPYWYDPEDQGWYDNSGYLTERVTHWMPLPEPPKDGDA